MCSNVQTPREPGAKLVHLWLGDEVGMEDPVRATSAGIPSWLGGAWNRLVQADASAATRAAASPAPLARTMPDATSARILRAPGRGTPAQPG